MARYEMLSTEQGLMGTPPLPETYLALGLQSSTGRDGAVDLVAAHKWFNIAAAKGLREAVRMRSEVAAEMSPSDIAEAQRAARDFLRKH
jgi:TPR repeat protein